MTNDNDINIKPKTRVQQEQFDNSQGSKTSAVVLDQESLNFRDLMLDNRSPQHPLVAKTQVPGVGAQVPSSPVPTTDLWASEPQL